MLAKKVGVCPGLLRCVNKVLMGVLKHGVPTAGESGYKCSHD